MTPTNRPGPPPSAPRQRVARLAPSPTGRLHLGNLSSALLAWTHARATGARLLLRIEDLDPPRVVPGADRALMHDLRRLGIEWDAGPDGDRTADDRQWYQSERSAVYRMALAELDRRGLVYRCFCSRRDISEALSAPHARRRPRRAYPGTCSRIADDVARQRARAEPFAWRFRARGALRLDDGVAGPLNARLEDDPGDFVIARKDGLFAYQLAVVVDDAAMGVTDVLRGRDLLDSALRQAALFDALDAQRPTFWHVPLLLDEHGERLSKRRRDISLDGLLDSGWTPATLRGALAWLWGWTDDLDAIAPEALPRLWTPIPLNRPSIRVPDALFEGPDALIAGSRRITPHPRDNCP
ncbi:MAG: tRNA glutamyl-Q(34) synthetase GluQRS [Deltaproteobacteria bacterium]|nr:MAG: tRNA glutamyl-Q(34) synthetase GluQRS [Deltaproteobacteria bacterium]